MKLEFWVWPLWGACTATLKFRQNLNQLFVMPMWLLTRNGWTWGVLLPVCVEMLWGWVDWDWTFN